MATLNNLNFVQQLYVAYYGRPADSAGLQFWAGRADTNGQASIVTAFGESPEFQERFGSLDSPALVNNLYQQLFGRDGDSKGVEYYTGVLERGEKSLSEIALTIENGAQGADKEAFNSRVDAASAYTQKNGGEGSYDLEDAKEVIDGVEWLSTEDFVQQLYVAYYGRPAESEGLTFWSEQADSQGWSSIIEAFGNSKEFQDEYGNLSNEALVNNLYQQLFGRDAEPEGLAYYTGVLDRGEKSLSEIAVTIFYSAEGEDKDVFDARVDAANGYTDQFGGDAYDAQAGKALISAILPDGDTGGGDTGGGDNGGGDTGGGDTGGGDTGGGDTGGGDTGGGDTGGGDNGGGDTGGGDNGGGDTGGGDNGGGDNGGGNNGGGDTDDGDTDGGDTGGGDTGGGDTGGGDNEGGDPVKAYNDFDDLADALSKADNALQAAYREEEPTEQLLADYVAAETNVINGFTATEYGDDPDIFREITGERKALEKAVVAAGGEVNTDPGSERAYPADEEEVSYDALSRSSNVDDPAMLFSQNFDDNLFTPQNDMNGVIDDGSASLIGIEDSHAGFGNDMIA